MPGLQLFTRVLGLLHWSVPQAAAWVLHIGSHQPGAFLVLHETNLGASSCFGCGNLHSYGWL